MGPGRVRLLLSPLISMGSTLVLNTTYEPVAVVSARRAAVLVLRGKATMMQANGGVLRAEHIEIPLPSVVKLTRYVKVPHLRGSPVTRTAIFARDGFRCQYCEGPAETLDHVLPKSRGGTHSWENVVACCQGCNLRKGSRTPAEWGRLPHSLPAKPHRFGWVYARAGRRFDPTWREYLIAG